MLGIAGCERLITRDFLLQVARDQLADGIEHYAHEFPPRFFARIFVPLAWSQAVSI
jgi:hypothetical protein